MANQKKALLWLCKDHGVCVLYRTIERHLTHGWAESTVSKNETLLEASPHKRCPQSFLNPFFRTEGDLSEHPPACHPKNLRQEPAGRQARHPWDPRRDGVAGMLGRNAAGLEHQRVPPAQGEHGPPASAANSTLGGLGNAVYILDSWVYSTFPLTPDCAPNQSCADPWSWANPSQASGPTKRRREQCYGLQDNPPLPHAPVTVPSRQLAPAGKSQLALFIYFPNEA